MDLAHLPPDDPTVYSTLQKADTIGMFQIESRAQMSCLPRLRPKCFYDIVVQVAIIRPGPIVVTDGQSLFAAPHGTRVGQLLASFARTRAEAHFRRASVSVTIAAHSHGCRQFYWSRSRRTGPRHGIQALAGSYEGYRGQAPQRHGTQWHRPRGAGANYSLHYFVCVVWISRIDLMQPVLRSSPMPALI